MTRKRAPGAALQYDSHWFRNPSDNLTRCGLQQRQAAFTEVSQLAR